MFISFESRGSRRDLAVEWAPTATVRDLVSAALGECPPGADTYVDGRVVDLDGPLAGCGLHEGAIVAVGGRVDGATLDGGAALVTVGGLRSGEWYPLSRGRSIV